ncbi:MAG: hypothetical protein A2Y89_01185 [Chloroflexi bacterium RBG_13_51_18]|nr:MAG: hypothetical protein A2Y89_01185 [Chloroflexi bacterium RBG_13_51_18]
MAADSDNLVRLTKADIKAAAEVLAKAFQEYPLTAYFIPDASKRLRKQASSFGGLIWNGIQYGEVYATSSKMEGVAVWFLSDNRKIPPWRRPFIGRLFTMLFVDRALLKRQKAFGEYAGAVRKRVAPFPHWYLQVLGVDPEYQGQGFSSRLVKPMFSRADKEGLSCFLETQAERNVALYEHLGFRVVEEGIIPGSGIKSWAMLRKNDR